MQCLSLLFILVGSLSAATVHPNIVFILTDDQDAELGGEIPIAKARKLIGDQGMVFTRQYVSSPLCCPSRSSILTGKYVHSHKAVNNSVSGNCSSPDWQKNQETQAVPVFLKAQGYKTFFAGKYLNQYGMKETGGVKHVPPGWDQWNGLVGNSRYYKYTLSVNGQPETHGDKYPDDYLTDVINKKATKFLDEQTSTSGPFFMMLSTPACHAPFTPAPQYANSFPGIKAPRNGSFNIHGTDKHWLIRQAVTPMANESITFIDKIYRQRWQTLLSVDDMVENIVALLERKGLMSNTYIFFTSDNGYHLGQFSLPNDKRQLYEFDVRVPFMVRGPGVKAGSENNELVTTVDLAPTFMDIANLSSDPLMDGLSLLPILKGSSFKNPRYYVAIEHTGEFHTTIPGCPQYDNQGMANCESNCVCEDSWNNTYGCMIGVSADQYFKYCEVADNEHFTEHYDLQSDRYELKNLWNSMSTSPYYHGMKKTLSHLLSCSGASCHKDPSHLTHKEIMQFLKHR